MNGFFHYHSFGFHVASEIRIPLLNPIDDSSSPDITIHRGDLSSYSQNQNSTAESFYKKQTGDFLIRNGEEIIVDTEKPLPDSFLCPEFISTILRQRHMLSVHGTAICKNGLAIIICGDHGAGKSTLAAEFIRNGWKFMTDDIAVIERDQSIFRVRPGNPVQKLWKDAIAQYQQENAILRAVPLKNTNGEFYIDARNFYQERKRCIECIVFLEKTDRLTSVRELTGFEKITALYSCLLSGFQHSTESGDISIPPYIDAAASIRMLKITRGTDSISAQQEFQIIHDFFESFIVKIAHTKVLIKSSTEECKSHFRKYLTCGTPDFSVNITNNQLHHELTKISVQKENAPTNPLSAADRFAVFRSIAEKMPLYQAFLIHGSAISFCGQGLVFVASSGTGKSTFSLSWARCFPSKVHYVNDDKPLISLKTGAPTICGTPWCGKHGRGSNTYVPLKSICFLERDQTNHIRKIRSIDALPMLLSHVYQPEKSEGKDALFSLISHISSMVDFYIIGCNLDADACITSKEVLFPDESS